MFTIEEIKEMLIILDKEKNWILTLKMYYQENPDILYKIVGETYKERLELINNIIEKLKMIEVALN